jgi:hypothetical protein
MVDKIANDFVYGLTKKFKHSAAPVEQQTGRDAGSPAT